MMMTNLEKRKLFSEIADRGFEAEEMMVTKNSVHCHGIRLTNPNCSEISAVVYLSDDDSYDEIFEKVMAAIAVRMDFVRMFIVVCFISNTKIMIPAKQLHRCRFSI